jgi:hypothetical protein
MSISKHDIEKHLKSDPSAASFMLSRTMRLKDATDATIAGLLNNGIKLCANSSLPNFKPGSLDWVSRYGPDAKKTKCGVLILDGGDADEFYESKPACDEIYAAYKAGVQLTRLWDTTFANGKYLWMQITDEIFNSRQAYESFARAKHGAQFTPIYRTVTMGSPYFNSFGTKKNHRYTLYGVLPTGAQARANGADKQTF